LFGFRKKTEAELPIEKTPPTLGELVDLHAQISEPTEPEALGKILKPPLGSEGQYIWRVYRSDSKVAGFLRAWTDGTYGIVQDIVVSRDHRGEQIARALLAHLTADYRTVQWKGDSRRVAPNLDRHLTVVRILYAVGLTFGYQKVVEGSYFQFLHRFSAPPNVEFQVLPFSTQVIMALLVAALGFLGIRIFWATGNIRRYVLRQMIFLNPPKTWHLLTLHFPLLLLHGALFFFLCHSYQDICLKGLNEPYVYGLLIVFITLLLLNLIWLCCLRVGEKDGPKSLRPPERFWAINNSTFAGIGLAFGLLLHCLNLGAEYKLLIVTLLILANNAVNFATTGRNYILGDALGGA
jgi:GNAT superfamily N-acetyltransferase